jgi:hypothetical protein
MFFKQRLLSIGQDVAAQGAKLVTEEESIIDMSACQQLLSRATAQL